MRFATVIGVGLAFLGFSSADEKKASIDTSKLNGSWTFVSGVKNGAKSADESLKPGVKITKDLIQIGEGDMRFEFKYTIDAKADPATIDLEMTKSPFGAGMKAKGIISLTGDELKLCYTENERPKKFDGEKAFLFTLKRKKN